jgi:hypothetical protein
LLAGIIRLVHPLLPYDKKDGQSGRALRDVRAVNSLGTQITPGVQHANKINDDTEVLSHAQLQVFVIARDMGK